MASCGRQSNIESLIASIKEEQLRHWVELFSGLRHGQREREILEQKGLLLKEQLEAMGLEVELDSFRYRQKVYFNVVATLSGQDASLPPYLTGAHYDASLGSPGADDNASGVAALLAIARVLSQSRPRRTFRFVGFNLEEPQHSFDARYRHGSRHFSRKARFRGDRYDGVFILESIGYTNIRPGSQKIPIRLNFRVPDAGIFIGMAGNRRARGIMKHFEEIAKRYVPSLPVISYEVAFRGWILPMSRMSDNAPFWDWGYPAVMLTDTAFLRNPHYHQTTDLPNTLDLKFLANVAKALAATLASG